DSVDICQSVLASFFARASWGQFDLNDCRQLLQLLLRMARNKVAFAARWSQAQQRDHRRLAASAVDDLGLEAEGASPSRVAAGRELLEEVRRRLTEEEREVAELRSQGYGWAEIAAELGGTADGLRMQLKRALDRVKQDLNLEDNTGK